MLLTPVSTPFGEESCASPDEDGIRRPCESTLEVFSAARIVDLSFVITYKP